MSPDILQGLPVGLHDDIYSFGITIWQLKTNKHPYHKIRSNDFVAYHVVKSNLRPDSQTKFFKTDENMLPSINTNSKCDSSRILCKNFLLGGDSTNRKTYKLLTPNCERKPLITNFLSADRLNKYSKFQSSVSHNVMKKLDFNLVQPSENKTSHFTPRRVNQNIPMVKKEICVESENHVFEKENFRNVFKDLHRNLPKYKKTKIENEYSKMYKNCWEQNALNRPSSEVAFNLLNSLFDLFD